MQMIPWRFIDNNPKYIENAKCILKGFEGVSGLSINLSKSELIPLNIPTYSASSMANLLGCKLGKLPITYLGLNLHFKKASFEFWRGIIKKYQSKLQSWKSKILGRLILVNAVLSAHALELFSNSPLGKIRSLFGLNDKKKLYMANWDMLCTKKVFGGLGIINLKDMNMALLSKWWFNYWNHGVKGKWKEILIANYEKNLASFFWDSVQNVSELP